MIFTLYKGFHFSNQPLHKLLWFINKKKRMSYLVTFNESALYVDTTSDRYDINKLFGFSNGMHHTNSYRFGWNCLYDKIYLYSYAYVEGVRISNLIGSVDINKQYRCTICVNKNECIFTLIDTDNNIEQDIIKITDKKILGYRLWPYFGGNNVAPHKITIELIKN